MKRHSYEYLKWTTIGEQLEPEELERLSDRFEPVTYLRGDRIFSRGTVGIGIIVEGKAGIYTSEQGGTSPVSSGQLIATVSRNEVIGEMSLLDDALRSGDVVAEEKVTVLLMPRTEFERMVEEEPRLAVRLLIFIAGNMARRIRRADGYLERYYAGAAP